MSFIKPFITPFIHEAIQDHAEDKNQRIFFCSTR